MLVYRIVLQSFGETSRAAFSGLSGFCTNGRWHSQGRYLDYTAESRSLATLERLVHYKRFDSLASHAIYTIDLPGRFILDLPSVPKGWDGVDPLPAAQALGNQWCDALTSPALKVPSAVTPGEHNLLINTRHPDWDWKWVVSGPDHCPFDNRLSALISRTK